MNVANISGSKRSISGSIIDGAVLMWWPLT